MRKREPISIESAEGLLGLLLDGSDYYFLVTRENEQEEYRVVASGESVELYLKEPEAQSQLEEYLSQRPNWEGKVIKLAAYEPDQDKP